MNMIKYYTWRTIRDCEIDIDIMTKRASNHQHAPVEKLLNPLSSKPYNVEEQANNKLSSLNELEGPLAITFPLPIVIAAVISVVWLLLLNRIWRKDIMKNQILIWYKVDHYYL
jgi:hypothetical protein